MLASGPGHLRAGTLTARTIARGVAFWNRIKCHFHLVLKLEVLVMASPPIPEDIRRFVLTSIPSVPHLEALLLLRASEDEFWSDARLAGRLYIGDKTARTLMTELCRSGMVAPREQTAGVFSYRYAPCSPELRSTIDTLAELYARQLLEVTHLIHAKLDRKAQQFADAFKWRKDS